MPLWGGRKAAAAAQAALILLLLSSAATAAPLNECRTLERHGKTREASACYTRLTGDRSAFLRAEGDWRLGRYDDANNEFKVAVREQPQSPEVRVEWGLLFLERFNNGDATNLFNEALKLDENYAPAYLGMARVAAQGYSKQAVEYALQALAHNDKYTEAHELLSFLALEDGQEKLATEEAGKALQLSNEALDALSVLASIDYLKTDGAARNVVPADLTRLLAINPAYGKAYETGAHFLIINRRYPEGIALYRKAVELTPDLWSARSQLGVNLMRLGQSAEARTELTRCYNAHFRDAETVNALRLLDTLGDYETFTTPDVELVIHKREAALLRPYVQPELERAVATYSRKYKMHLPDRIRLELYPNHDDFAVRVLGLPGQGGLSGVTFGTVVAMDSPSANPPGQINWASTMWHELSHVYVVTATHQLVPRWFTEGLAVHEEGVVSSAWGNRLTPTTIEALRGKKLLPVLSLDRGFIRPEYPTQVLVSYFEAGKMLDFIASKWGDAAILGMIRSYGLRQSTEQAITENLHETPAALDKEFAAWLDSKTSATVHGFDDWKTALKAAHDAFATGSYADAVRQATAARAIYPDYVGAGSADELLADAHAALKANKSAADDLEHYRDAGGTAVEVLKKEAALETDNGRAEQARRTLEELSYIYPQDQELHQRWGNLLLDAKQPSLAVREFQALLELKPADPVEAHYRLANALHSSGRDDEARDQVVAALEDAPRYRPAQRLLLQLTQPKENP